MAKAIRYVSIKSSCRAGLGKVALGHHDGRTTTMKMNSMQLQAYIDPSERPRRAILGQHCRVTRGFHEQDSIIVWLARIVAVRQMSFNTMVGYRGVCLHALSLHSEAASSMCRSN